MLDQVLRYIDNGRDGYVARLSTYLCQPSIATTGTGMPEAAELACATMSAAGLESRIVNYLGYPFVIGEWLRAPSRPTVLLYGHYVQPPGEGADWVTPPFEPAIRDGRIYARGVGDNKGQHFAQLMAIEAHVRATGSLPCNVIFLLEGEEEIGSPNIAGFVESNRDELAADLVVVSDGPLHESGHPVIKYGCRGLLGLELVASGARRDVHSGNYGGVAPNPAWSLVQLLASMKASDGMVTIDGFYDNVAAPTEMELAAMQRLPVDVTKMKEELGIAELDHPVDRPFFERLMFQPTLTINGLTSGYGGPGVKTIIPSQARAKLDVRLVDKQTPGEIYTKIAAHIHRVDAGIELSQLNAVLPSKTPMESQFADAIRSAIFDAQGERPYEYPSGGGTLPLYVFTKILGLPTFMVPYANHDEANHAPNENMTLRCFHNGIRTGAAMLSRIGDLAQPSHDRLQNA